MAHNIPIDSSNSDEIRAIVMNQFCTLMQVNARAYHFKKSIDELVDNFLMEIKTTLQKDFDKLKPCNAMNDIKQLPVRCTQLLETLQLLRREEENYWEKSSCFTKDAIINFNDISEALSLSFKQLEYFSTHDPVTNLHNRQYFNDILHYEISRSERHDYEFIILLIDVDDFKCVNDSFGHPCGDLVLLDIAELFRANLRKGDIIARIGGDEFAVILTETRVEEGQQKAEELRQAVDNFAFNNLRGGHLRSTVSIGIISFPNDAKSTMELMSGVDLALYHAKKRGKNEVYTLSAIQAISK